LKHKTRRLHRLPTRATVLFRLNGTTNNLQFKRRKKMPDSPFLANFATAVREYPKDSVTLQIVDRAPVDPPTGPNVNTNEIWKLRIRVRNNGHLDMTGVALRITGQNGVKVNTTNAPEPHTWPTSLAAFGNLNIKAHNDTPSGFIYFFSPAGAQPAGTDLVCAQIARFDVNLNHILIDHSGSSTLPRVCYEDQVFPS
jgi:hypothetical protein